MPEAYNFIKIETLAQVLACNLIKIETLVQMFSCKFCEISKNTFFTEHVWAAASMESHVFLLLFPNLKK